MTGAGLKKWIPSTRSGWVQAAAIAVTDREDVLVARRAASPTTGSIRRKLSRLIARSSTIASITSPQPGSAAIPSDAAEK